MKKTFLLAIALCLAIGTRASEYEPEAGMSWRALLGVNISSIRGGIMDDNGRSSNVSAKAGLDFGIMGEYVLPNAHGTYLGVGLEWTQKGGKQKMTEEGRNGESYLGTRKINEHYISIPIHIGFRHNFSDDWGVFCEAGPYLAVGVTGKHKFSPNQEGTEAKRVAWSEKTFKKNSRVDQYCGGFQRFDVGVGFRVGVECLEHYSINLGWDWGLADMLREEYRDNYYDLSYRSADKLKNFCFSITLGYRF